MEDYVWQKHSVEDRFRLAGDERIPPVLPFMTRYFFLAGAVVLSVMLVYHLVGYLNRSPENIRVFGNRILTTDDLVQQLRIQESQSWLSIDPYRLSLQLKQHCWVDKAMVHRSFPLSIDVYVVERVPMAYLKTADDLLLLGSDRLVLKTLPGGIWDLPIIVNQRLKAVAPGTLLAEASLIRALHLMSLLEKDPVLPLTAVSEIDITDPFNTELVTMPYGIRLKMGFEDFERKLAAIKIALPYFADVVGNIDYLDLRTVRGVVLKKIR
jgi:hypothetical protein